MLSAAITGGGGTITVSVGGNYTITMSANATGSATSDPLTIYHGLYRLVGALRTDSTPNIVAFHQNGDTFYLDKPVNDNATVGSSTPTLLTLSGVPSGVAVEGFGRCVGGSNKVILFTPGTAPGAPAGFPTVPGYGVQATTPSTAFPWRLYTNTSQQIDALASGAGTTLQCMTDGWVLHR